MVPLEYKPSVPFFSETVAKFHLEWQNLLFIVQILSYRINPIKCFGKQQHFTKLHGWRQGRGIGVGDGRGWGYLESKV